MGTVLSWVLLLAPFLPAPTAGLCCISFFQSGVPVTPHTAAAVCHQARAPVLLTLMLIGLYVEVEEGDKKAALCSIGRIQAILGSL